MVVKIYKVITEDEEKRYDTEPMILNINKVSSKVSNNNIVLEGVKSQSRTLSFITYQSPINDLAKHLEVGDKLEYQGCSYTIKSIDSTAINFNNRGKRKYIIAV